MKTLSKSEAQVVATVEQRLKDSRAAYLPIPREELFVLLHALARLNRETAEPRAGD